MLLVRFIALLLVLGTGGSVLAWLLTGNPSYRTWAWRLFQAGVLLLLAVLGIFAIERLIS